MLLHCLIVESPERVVKSFRTVVRVNEKAVIVDLGRHSSRKFLEEMGYLHLEFEAQLLVGIAEKHFLSSGKKDA